MSQVLMSGVEDKRGSFERVVADGDGDEGVERGILLWRFLPSWAEELETEIEIGLMNKKPGYVPGFYWRRGVYIDGKLR